MTLPLTETAEREASKLRIEPQLVLEIDGVATLYGAVEILKLIHIGDPGLEIGDDWVIGGMNPIEDQEDLISLDGTGTKIDQQIRPDLGSVSSISSILVSLVDADNLITQLITPGLVVEDLLGSKCKLYLGLRTTAWPEDYIVIFGGFIDDILSESGKVTLNLAHPEQKKRAKIFQQVKTKLAAREAVFTVTIASPGVFTSIGHNLANDQTVGLFTTGSLPTGLSPNTTYYVINRAANTFQLSASQGGAAINTSGSQSGVHTFHTGVNSGDTETTIYLEDASMLVVPITGPSGSVDQDTLKCYVRIEDEIIRYTGVTGDAITGCTRHHFDTVAIAHAIEADVSSFYQLEGDAVSLALKLMLSGTNGYFKTDVDVSAINQVSATLNVPNALFFQGIDVAKKYGLVEGDYVTLVGSSSDFTLKTIRSIELINDSSYLVIEDVTLATELTTPGTVSFRSQYDTLGEGLKLDPDQVDVAEHLFWQNIQLSFYNYRFYLKDTLDGKEFIDKQIYAPIGAFSIPRKGRCSLGYHIGPIAREDIQTLDKNNIKAPASIKMRRTINKNFYNAVVYKYDESALEDKFLGGTIVSDGDSIARIPVGIKPLTFEAKGLRSDLDAGGIAARAGGRLLDRYRFGAEHFENLKIFFKAGFNLEAGDIILLDPEDLKISNTIDGTRNKLPKFFEATNKSLDLKTGDVTLSITDTSFGTDERYGVVSPSSVIAGGTTLQLTIQESFGGVFPGNESRKWKDYVGLPILVHSEDFTFSEQVDLLAIDPVDPNVLYLGSALSMAPVAGWIVDIPPYPDDTDRATNRLYKLFHVSLSPLVPVVSGASDTEFDVDPADTPKFFEGSIVRVHNEDFSDFSEEVRVTAIVGDTITVSDSLGFTPDSTHLVQFIGFADQDPAYRWI